MTALAQATDLILAHPAPVIALDTCTLIDLFRRRSETPRWRVPTEEIQAATELLQLAAVRPVTVHLIVPELVPREFADNSAEAEKDFALWLEEHDKARGWVIEASNWLGVVVPQHIPLLPFNIHSACRAVAQGLLSAATILDRDRDCLDRAIARVVNKRRPSHSKEVKDSMNLEQVLEMCRRLSEAGFVRNRVFISSNTKDFAVSGQSTGLHPDLEDEFKAVGLEYFTNMRAAIRKLQARGQLP